MFKRGKMRKQKVEIPAPIIKSVSPGDDVAPDVISWEYK